MIIFFLKRMVEKIKITFPDNSVKEYNKGITALEIASSISHKLRKEALAVKINDKIKDLDTKINEDSKIKFLTFEDEEGKQVFWHSSAHILAEAITSLWPETKLTIGPAIKEGFYYDVDREPFTEEELKKIEEKAYDIIKKNEKITRKEIPKETAKELFKDNPYKLELLEEFEDDVVSVYYQGNFYDLCRGPHIPNTGLVKAFKVLKASSAYWRGDQNNKQLQRVYGISFPKKSMLEEWEKLQEEIKKRDHRKLGKELDLFFTSDLSPGSPFFHPKGTIIYNELINLFREEYKKRNYKEVITPVIYNKKLWEISGHWEAYRENMFTLDVEGQTYALKAMNCPGHVVLFKNKTRSYRDLPLRIAEFGIIHRNELSGTLTGLTRVRKFVQDDAHIFVAEEQLFDEMKELLDFVNYIYKDVFKMNFRLELSTRPEKYIGDLETWNKAEETLKKLLDELGYEYTINEGDGAFYGPKIDLHVEDVLKRSWQLATIQLDFNMPQRFDATYEDKDGTRKHPIMIHRAILGTIERFMGIIIEHYAGKFPVWLSPEQVRVIPVNENSKEYAEKVKEYLHKNNIRVEASLKPETVSYKVREAQLQKVPYIIVVGDKEKEKNTVTVRSRENKILGEFKLEDFKNKVLEKIKTKTEILDL